MTQSNTGLTQLDTGPIGNTKIGPSKSKQRARSWIFVQNNPENHNITKDIIRSKLIDAGAEKFSFQLEAGANDTIHFQGVVDFKNARYFDAVKKLLPQAHWEKTNNVKASYDYTAKVETRIDGPWTYGLPEEIEVITELRPFQQEIVDITKTKPDNRTIHWYWESTGNVGKTSLAKYLCKLYKDEAIYLSGKAGDIKCAIAAHINSGKRLKVAIFGFTRTMEEYVSYEAIEAIKDGIFFNGKYESGMVMYNPPHVICLGNFAPKTEKLSNDRWNIIQIGETVVQEKLDDDYEF